MFAFSIICGPIFYFKWCYFFIGPIASKSGADRMILWKSSQILEFCRHARTVLLFVVIRLVVAQSGSGTKCDCKPDWLGIRSPLEEMKYWIKFIFLFLRSGVEAKCGVEFCHSTRNAFRIRQKVGNGVY